MRTVKCNHNLKLNNEFDDLFNFDEMELEDIQRDIVDSLPDAHVDDIWGVNKMGDGPLNMSYPGLNQSIDPEEKRKDLLHFFELVAEEEAEQERRAQEMYLNFKMKKDADCMYDSQLIDNCFFTSKEKVEKMQ